MCRPPERTPGQSLVMEGADMMRIKNRVDLATSAGYYFTAKRIACSTGRIMLLLSSLFAVLCPMPVLANYAKFPTYHDSLAESVPSFRHGVCLYGTIQEGHFSVANLASHKYFFLHLDKPVNVMPPVSKDPAFLNPYFHTYDVGLLLSMQSGRYSSGIVNSVNKKISLTGDLEIIMMALPGQSQPPLTVFLNVSKVGGAAKCAS